MHDNMSDYFNDVLSNFLSNMIETMRKTRDSHTVFSAVMKDLSKGFAAHIDILKI